MAEAKAYLRRMGATGRFTLYMFSVVFVAALIPWTYRAGVGYDEGVTTSEGFGVFLLAAIGASVHLLRYRRRMPGKIGLALLTLLAAVAAPVLMAYLLSEIGDIEEQIRPLPQFGFYLAALASALATLGSLVCLKDVR